MEWGFPPVPGFVYIIYIIPCDLSLYLYRLVKVVQIEDHGFISVSKFRGYVLSKRRRAIYTMGLKSIYSGKQ